MRRDRYFLSHEKLQLATMYYYCICIIYFGIVTYYSITKLYIFEALVPLFLAQTNNKKRKNIYSFCYIMFLNRR